MTLEQETMKFVERLKELYFVRRDVAGLLALMRADVSWLGTGDKEMSRGIDAAACTLQADVAEYGGSFRVEGEELHATRLSDTLCLVYGFMRAEATDGRLVEPLHVSAVCERTPDGMRLVHLHFARPDSDQEAGHCFPTPDAHGDAQVLRNRLQSRERQIENLTRNIPGGVHQCANDEHFTLLGMSDGFLRMFGYTRDEIRERFHDRFLEMLHPADRAPALSVTREQLSRGLDIELEYRVLCKDGRAVWILDKGRLLDDGIGGHCFYCILIEINDRKCAQEELRLSLERHQVILDQATDIIFEWDIKRDSLLFSPNWRKKFGYDPIERKISSRIPLSRNIHPDDMPAFVEIMRDTAAGVPYSETEFRILDGRGKFVWCRVRATAQFDSDHRPIKAVGVITDVSIEKRERQELMDMAQRDALTGLYNKSAVRACIEQQMNSVSGGNLPHAMFIIDVDNFKAVNDTYGHPCGDALLAEVADALKRNFRSSDLLGRIGGDEFLVYLPQVASREAAEVRARALQFDLKAIRPTPDALPISCSIGGALFARGAVGYQSLYQCADRALYQQKNMGKNGVSFYDPAYDTPDEQVVQTAVGTAIDSDQMNAVDEKLVQYAFRMLYSSRELPQTFRQVMEMVGRAYDVSRVYILEKPGDGAESDLFAWRAPEAPDASAFPGDNTARAWDDYLRNFEDGVFCCADVRMLPASLCDALETLGVCATLQCAMYDAGRFVGYVSFDECRDSRVWTRQQVMTLTLIANLLSVFLNKLRAEEKLHRLTKQLS